MDNAKLIAENLKEFTGVLTKYTRSSWCGKGSRDCKKQKGYGHVVIDIGDVRLGDSCEKNVEKMLEAFISQITEGGG